MTDDIYGWWGWAPEPDITGDGEGDSEKHFLTITENGEEFAVIVHRIVGGKYPIDGDLANEKVEHAKQIVDALNGAGRLACAECGTTEAQTYVVTTLDPEDPRGTRTEVCLSCHDVIERRVAL